MGTQMGLAAGDGPTPAPHMDLGSQAQMSPYSEGSHHGPVEVHACTLVAEGRHEEVAVRHGGCNGGSRLATPHWSRTRRTGRAPILRAYVDLSGVCATNAVVVEAPPLAP